MLHPASVPRSRLNWAPTEVTRRQAERWRDPAGYLLSAPFNRDKVHHAQQLEVYTCAGCMMEMMEMVEKHQTTTGVTSAQEDCFACEHVHRYSRGR